MTRKQQNSERLQKRILQLSNTGMTQSAIAEKIHRSPVYVSRALKKYDVRIRLEMMNQKRAMEILPKLSRWELLLLLRVSDRMKNYDAAVCLFDPGHQEDVADLLPYFKNSQTLQQKVRNIFSPPKKQK